MSFSVRRFNFAGAVLSLCLFFISVNSSFSQGKYELNVAIRYDMPRYEASGNDATFDPINVIVSIGGKRIINSDNLSTRYGYGLQITGSMKLFKTDYIKALGGFSFTQLASKYTVPNENDSFYGVRLYVFSIAAGLQVNPIGIHRFYPSVVGLFRFNEFGGETYHFAGLDFFVVSPRFGYSAGMDLNYKFSKSVGMSFGMRYNYDNWLNKQTAETNFSDEHAINFSDLQSAANGLTHDRRIVYVSILTGINIYFK